MYEILSLDNFLLRTKEEINKTVYPGNLLLPSALTHPVLISSTKSTWASETNKPGRRTL